MKSKPDPRDIAEEAVGQRLGSEPPEAVREREKISVDETVRRLAKSSGSEASIPAKTAESVGERVGDAYADAARGASPNPPGKIARRAGTQYRSQATGTADPVLQAGRQVAQLVSHQFEEQPFMTMMAGFILGYITALLLHAHR